MILRGKTLTISAKGNFKEDVEDGAKIHLEVKYGLITLIKQEADLCETIDEVDLSCPLKKGEMTLTKDVDLPAQIPPVSLLNVPTDPFILTAYNRGTMPSWPTYTPKTGTKSPVSRPRFPSTGKYTLS